MASPEAHDGLGLALWWLNEIGAAHHHRTQAFLLPASPDLEENREPPIVILDRELALPRRRRKRS